MMSILAITSAVVGLAVLGLGIYIKIKAKGCMATHFMTVNWATIGAGAGIAALAILSLVMKGKTHPMVGGILSVILGAGVCVLGYMTMKDAKTGGACSAVKYEAYGLLGGGVLLLLMGVGAIVMGMKKGGAPASAFF